MGLEQSALGCTGATEDAGASSHVVPAETRHVLRALEANLMHERRAQQELVYLVSARVLDAVQWCTVAASLHPLHCDLEPLLKLSLIHI